MKTKKMVLCKGRHESPKDRHLDGFIYHQVVNPMDFEGLERAARRSLLTILDEGDKLELYVTGCTPALIATLNAADDLGISASVYHYDRDSKTYKQQLLSWGGGILI